MAVRKRKTAKLADPINGLEVLTEEQEQFILVGWLRKKNVIHYAVPNGGKRSMHEAIKFKRGGVMAGVPDLVIPLARKPYHGLYIELKRTKGGSLSGAQRWWIEALKVQGYQAVMCHGATKAISVIEEYLKLPYWEKKS